VAEWIDHPPEILDRVRAICRGLPEAYEEQSWAGRRWRIRKRTFADLRTADTDAGPCTFIKFRSRGPELHALLQSGHPFFPAGYGEDVVGMLLDGSTNWTELAEVLTESYLLFAPKKLASRLRG
jgi:hypothetical protein